MHDEQDIIPYETQDPPPGPWLVFAPHPDDESFGMGGTLIRARDTGIPVHIVFVTDGARGGGDAQATREVRKKEAESACRYLNARGVHFWEQPDRALRPREELANKVAALAAEVSPACVFIPSLLEPHPDHRTTARIVWGGLRKMEQFQGQVLAYDVCTQGPVNTIVDITAVAVEKRELMALYESQVSDGKYIDIIEALDRARTFTLPAKCRAAEGFYRCSFPPSASLELALLPWLRSHLETTDRPGEPLVSIIVRTRNRPGLLAKALSSVLAQTHPRIELVVVNDGEEDVAALVADAGRHLEAYHCVPTGEHRGRGAAANRGLEQAAGEYFLFLDDDDWLDPPHLSTLVEAVAGSDTLVAYTGVRAVSGDHELDRVFNTPFDRNRLYYDNYIPIHAALVSRSVIDAGIRFDESLEVLEDWDFWLQVLQRTVSFLHVDGVTANYRVSRDQGIGVKGGYDSAKRLIYAKWSSTWSLDEIEDFMTRLTAATHRQPS